jgi:hypothetical protein
MSDPTYAELCQLCGRSARPGLVAAMSPVRIVFVTTNNKMGRLIRWRTWGAGPAHVGVMQDDGMVIHADLGKGVAEEHLPYIAGIGSRIDVFRVDIPHAAAELFWSLARAQIGKGYDFLGNIGFVVRKPMQSPTRWFCSELVAWLFWKAGRPLLHRVPSWKYAPEDIYRSPLLTYEISYEVSPPFRGKEPVLKWVEAPFDPAYPENARKRPSKAFEAETAHRYGWPHPANFATACNGHPGDVAGNEANQNQTGDLDHGK